ncbi:type II secretory pathway predicted ATPase ExeA [Thiogranum longum]|uniref:Type II secretory pathway predicted ATPase ExeA n=1 Tax=Thiogranum longum TaxID=1537524 RepID=A0A4R1HBM9_9GAMM|nr:AAA family ATPase [Thiogranum longum]TCK19394.1 type II secretory pathway predicted ATPase ExeA [Thiogranum longum]
MYESFYNFREKPFSLLPDSGFLYLSNKHRMALTLLEYGLMNQAGFTVISGDIGTGKTTLIRQLLNQIDDSIRVGLISNTHQTFGDLMQWIALAYDLPHHDKNKVELYQDFMDFIIKEYARGRRTVLIVDEAQNMSAETLEELRMLSNVNADKDQVLQIILVGQRELRDTLRRPDLVQFAQRIGVDYHLEPLDEQETIDYIRHRCEKAGGSIDLFTEKACHQVYEATGGVPRLINLLCDTTLVYGYAEQREHIDARLVSDVARDKQQGGLFAQNKSTVTPERQVSAVPAAVKTLQPVGASNPQPRKNGQLRIAIAAESELLRIYLSRLLSEYSITAVAEIPLTAQSLKSLEGMELDALLVELDQQPDQINDELYSLLESWKQPVLFNDSLATEASLSQPNREEYGRKLSEKLFSLVPHAPQSVA